jgi:hypothetical protein
VNDVRQLEQLLRLFLQTIDEVQSSGEELSDEFQGQLAEFLDLLINRIAKLKEEERITVGTPIDPAPHPSSQINAFAYDPKTQQLRVKFQDKYPGQNGPQYQYEGVPPFIFDVFRRGAVAPKTSGSNAWHRWKKGVTPSLGAAMNSLIKAGGYQYQRLA